MVNDANVELIARYVRSLGKSTRYFIKSSANVYNRAQLDPKAFKGEL